MLFAASTNVNEVYKVSVVSGGDTYFNQVDSQTGNVIPGTDLAYSVASVTGYTGTVIIGQAVPEPASIVSGSFGVVFLAVAVWVRRLTGSRQA